MDWREDSRGRWTHARGVADTALDECRVQLMLKFRFLDLALWRMPGAAVMSGGRHALATDGRNVYFEPYAVLARFGESFDELARDYLHLVMHCLLRHPYDQTHPRSELWQLACDAAAESAAMDLCAGRFPSDLDPSRVRALAELQEACGTLAPGKMFAVLSGGQGAAGRLAADPGKMQEYAALFARDNHETWPSFLPVLAEDELAGSQKVAETVESPRKEGLRSQTDELQTEEGDDAPSSEDGVDQRESLEGQGASGGGQDGSAEAPAGKVEADGDADAFAPEACGPQDSDDGRRGSQADELEWEELAKKMEMDLDTFSKEWGEEAGTLMRALRTANRKKHSYAEFLRRFARPSEEMRVNDDEFDYVFYTYGLKLYGNMPLIEPLEYRETRRVRDFVIALDTSESCEGELVRRFVEHTFSMLKSQDGFASKAHVRIVQCDAKVQSDTVVTDMRDVDALMDSFEVHGLGGTDFRPVFGYVEGLRARGELQDMQGLIYFTDGMGTYPQTAPDYDTAFVFVDDWSGGEPAVPPWAMRVVLDEGELGELRVRQEKGGRTS